MKIDRKLNLVIPVDRSDGTTAYVHSMPLSKLAFRANYLILAQTFTDLYTLNLGAITGPRVAALHLRALAEAQGKGPEIEQSLMAEIRRLTAIIAPGPDGWQARPWEGAAARGDIDEDDVDDVENSITYFIVASAIYKPAQLEIVLAGAAQLWSGQTTSLLPTDFASSLPTSMPVANTGARPTVIVS